jgi:N-hydroxyarylamine O-acetyltransferase
MDPTPYLARIHYTGPLTPTVDTLRELQRAHLFHVPFENLDIRLGRKILCDENASLAKIVQHRRGGFCYEMNGAFAALLREFGFKVTLLSACVPRDDGSAGPEFDHLALRVDLNEPWLVDVGFGDSFLDPLRLNPNELQSQNGQTYRLIDRDQALYLERLEDDVWKPQYNFTLQPRALQDFAPMCHYHAQKTLQHGNARRPRHTLRTKIDFHQEWNEGRTSADHRGRVAVSPKAILSS